MRTLLYVSLAMVVLGLVGAMAALSVPSLASAFIPTLILGGIGAVLLWFAVRRGATF